ncbi:MAG: NADH-quinone oxidoreductase subunit I [Nitrospinae bacterium]|nr:NADH-quinone oxidoreductase subunit I [Nitrospinota bacterium]
MNNEKKCIGECLSEAAKGAQALIAGMVHIFKHLFIKMDTIQYPEERREMPPSTRGRHYLRRYDDGLERCVGCSLCAANCPVSCIHVEAGENNPESPVSRGERHAKEYRINILRCIYCGYCEEACPTGAIVLRDHTELASYKRDDYLYNKEMLLKYPKYQPERKNFWKRWLSV